MLLVEESWQRTKPQPKPQVPILSADRSAAPVWELELASRTTLFPCSGQHAALERQLALFSSAEIIAELPETTKRRGRKAQPATRLRFECTLDPESQAEVASG